MNDIMFLRHAEFHARVILEPDFSNDIDGFDFSYPILNTIDIGNLLLRGGTKNITIERLGKSTWSYDKETSILKIVKKNKEEEHIIPNPKELYEAMSKYYHEEAPKIIDKNSDTQNKRIISMQGNQNAKKDINIYIDEYPKDCRVDIKLLEKVKNNNTQDFCELDDYIVKYNKTSGEYIYWLMSKGWLYKMNPKSYHTIKDEGYNIDIAMAREEELHRR